MDCTGHDSLGRAGGLVDGALAQRRIRYGILAGLLLAVLAAGCSQYIDPNVPEPIRPFADPYSEREYLLYRPSNYDRDLSWPLIVVCHGALPDSPNRQIRVWTTLAEARGFLLIAPKLTSDGRAKPRHLQKRLDQLRDDEAHILSAIQHVRAGHQISWDRIFIYGWGTGSRAAIYAALGNRRLFRAASFAEPRIGEEVLAAIEPGGEPFQPVNVRYRVTDVITGKHGRRLEDWFRGLGADLSANSIGTVKKVDTALSVEFFEEVIRRKPVVQLRAIAASGRNPLEFQFKARCSFEPVRYRWEFGDGGVSTGSAPSHLYRKAGKYEVKLTVEDVQRNVYTRTTRVVLP